MRHGAFDVLRAAVSAPWGLLAFASYAGAFDFLENRFSEYSKEGREWKFAVMEAAASNPGLALLPPRRAAALRLMLREGPFYVPYRPSDPVVE